MTQPFDDIGPMPEVMPRRPYDRDDPDGDQESLYDWYANNEEAVEWFLEHAERIAHLLKEHAALTADSRHLGNLLAALHGDGGQYQDEYGTDNAVRGAIALNYARLEKLERLEAERDEHTQTIARLEAHCAFIHNECAQYLKTIQTVTAERDTLTAERDEMKKRITELEHDFLGAHARHGQKKAERDQWKVRAERAEAERDRLLLEVEELKNARNERP